MSDFVAVGQHRVGSADGRISVLGLGSCVAIVLYDESTRIGGVAHVMLPTPRYSATPERLMKFASTAVPCLVGALVSAGAKRDRINARLVGGASMFEDLRSPDQPNIGLQNVAAARRALREDEIPIVGEEVGGDFGRSAHLDLADGSLRVTAQGREEVCV